MENNAFHVWIIIITYVFGLMKGVSIVSFYNLLHRKGK